MEALLCTNTYTGLPLPRRRAAPSTGARSVHIFLGRRSLPTRGLRCVGADRPESSSFVSVADKTDAAAPVAGKAGALAGTGGEEEKAKLPAINSVDGGELEDSASVPVTGHEKSLVVVDSVIDAALSKTLPSKLDFRETSTYIIYGTGAFFAGWVLSAIVSAIDSIPVLPKLLEMVGLTYTIWFSTRYLLFKENRDELFVKVDAIKRRIIGISEE